LSKAHSLAGFRVGYAALPEPIADDLKMMPIHLPARARRQPLPLCITKARFVNVSGSYVNGLKVSPLNCVAGAFEPFHPKPISSSPTSRRAKRIRSQASSKSATSSAAAQ